jgi:hypothetical protein
MIARRGLMAAGLATLATRARAASGIPGNGRLAFAVFRNDSPIGTHTLDFAAAGDALTVTIRVHFTVGFGPITLYRYDMQGTERWAGGRFAALDTQTDDDGTAHRVTVRREGGGLRVQSVGKPDRMLDGAALPLTHWAVACMSAPLFNPQDGVPITDRTTPEGAQTITLPDGRSIAARAYCLNGAMAIQDWYDDSQIWVQLKAKAKDGSQIEYRRA